MTRYVVDGREVEFLRSEPADGWVRDYWLDPADDADSLNQTGMVLTVKPTMSYEGMEPFIGWGGVYAIAWEVAVPALDPLTRLQEALRQGTLRHEERQSGVDGLAPLPRRYRTT